MQQLEFRKSFVMQKNIRQPLSFKLHFMIFFHNFVPFLRYSFEHYSAHVFILTVLSYTCLKYLWLLNGYIHI